jgi:hypothetical protein
VAEGNLAEASSALAEWEQSPDLDSEVSLSPWADGRFGTPCYMSFSYVVRYSAPGQRGSRWEESCGASGCDRFRSGALQAVVAAQGNPDATDERPVTTENVLDGVRYRVSVGRLTIGWRIFPDWRVKFVRSSDDAEVASLVVEASRWNMKEATAR